jgi:hypothetical protein
MRRMGVIVVGHAKRAIVAWMERSEIRGRRISGDSESWIALRFIQATPQLLHIRFAHRNAKHLQLIFVTCVNENPRLDEPRSRRWHFHHDETFT